MAELVKNLQKRDVSGGPAATRPGPASVGGVAALGRRDDFDRDVWCVLGMPVDAMDIDRAIGEIDAAIRERRKLSFVTPNVNGLVRALRDPADRREFLNADMSLVDGAPLAAMAKWLGVPVSGRAAGSDLFEALRRRPGFGGRRIKVFFFGGRDGAAEAAARALNGEDGGLEAVGWLNPGYGDVESMSEDALIAEINAAGADFIVVSLGAAKGQAWIERNRLRLSAPVIAHLGAVVDFTGGGVARAPKMFRRRGLEWLWRIKEDPALWRRYLGDGAALMSIALTRLAPQLLTRRSGPAQKAQIEVNNSRSNVVISLAGDMTRPNLSEVRAAFRAAVAGGSDVVLEISGVARMDPAFLGLTLMLEKHVGGRGRTVFVDGASKGQLAYLRANAMSYPNSPQSKRDLPAGRAAIV